MRHFPNWLRAYANHTNISEAPRAFHFWTGVSVIAAVLRRRVWIEQLTFQWTPNFYIVLVGPPGIATKSTSMRIGYRILRRVKGIHFGPQSMSWQGLLDCFVESFEAVKIGDMFYPQSCVTSDVSELGTFLKPTDGDMVNFLTDMWDGQIGPWNRKLHTSSDTNVENPWLNIIGCTTPSWLRDNFTSSQIFGGLTSRCVFVWGNTKERLVAYPAYEIVQQDFLDKENKLLDDLNHMAEKLRGPYELTPEAIVWGKAWYESHNKSRPEHLSSERFDSYLSRKQGHIHKLAMILSAAAHDDLMINKATLELSSNAVAGLEADMMRVFDSIGATDNVKFMDEILHIISSAGVIPRQELWRRCKRHMDEKQFQEAINGEISAGSIRMVSDAGHFSYRLVSKK